VVVDGVSATGQALKGGNTMELLIKLLSNNCRAINVAPQIQQAIRIGTLLPKAVEGNARNLLAILELAKTCSEHR
jgi:hypothetical protein